MKTYCSKPFNTLFFDGHMAGPCCLYFDKDTHGKILNDDVYKMFNSDTMKQIRLDMVNDRPVKGCQQCYEVESRGLKSERLISIERDGHVHEPKLEELQMSFNNICNLKCRFCVSANSYQLFHDEIAIYGRPVLGVSKYFKNESFHNINYVNLKRITIEGGEPFLTRDLDLFLEMLDKDNLIPNIELSIDTNGTVIPAKQTLLRLQKSSNLKINVSIDGIGKNTEFSRSKSNFQNILSNLEYFKTLQNCDVSIAISISVYNVNLLDEFYKFFEGNTITRRMVFWPDVMSPMNLPDDYKIKVIEKLKKSKFNFNDVIEHLQQPGENIFEHFLNWHFKLNELRNESFDGVNNMLNEYIKEYVKRNPTRIDSTEFLENQRKKISL